VKNKTLVTVAGLAFVAIFFFNVPFPILILGAGLIGFIGGRLRLPQFDLVTTGRKPAEEKFVITDQMARRERPSTSTSIQILLTGLLIWFIPLLLLALWLGGDHIFVQIGRFFSQTAVVTFGGAYAVLAYIAQQAVEVFGWLQPGEMLDGLGMAETTPGPLVQVVQFVGYMGAYRNPGGLTPLTSGIIGAIITTWATFVPCFLWIFLGAPYIEYLRGNKALSSALSAITAAVVGVILNLAVWFALQTLFGSVSEQLVGPLRLYIPQWNTLDWAALGIVIAAFVALFRLRWGMLATLGGCALLGIAAYFLF
jgi:chromate transporter